MFRRPGDRALRALDTRNVALALCLVGAAVAASLQGLALRSGYAWGLDRYATIVDSHASSLGAQWRDTLVDVETALATLDLTALADADADADARLAAALADKRALTSAARALWLVAAADGATLTSPPGLDELAAGPATERALAGGEDLVVGPRTRFGEEAEPVVHLVRALRDGRGDVVGAAGAAVSLEVVRAFHERLRLPPGSHVAILDRTGQVLLHTPERPELVGRPFFEPDVFAGLWHTPGELERFDHVDDERPRFAALEPVADYASAVMVSTPEPFAVAHWQRQLAWITAALASILVVLTLLGVATLRSHRRRDDALAVAGRRQRELTDLVERLVGLRRPDALVAELARGLRRVSEAGLARVRVVPNDDHGDPHEAVDGDEPDPHGLLAVLDETRPTSAEAPLDVVELGSGERRRRLGLALESADGGWSGRIDLVAAPDAPLSAVDLAVGEQLARVTSALLDKIALSGDLRRAVATVDERGAEIETIFRSISDAVYSLDADWRFTFVNPKAEELLRRPAAELVGRRLWEAFPEAAVSELKPACERAMREGTDVAVEFYYPPFETWFSVRAFPRADGLTVYFRDVSERIAADARLRQAQKMEALGQLTGGIAHDFNNLLTVVMGNLEMLVDRPDLARDDRESLEVALRASEQAAQLTAQLLAFARRQPLAPRDVDLQEIVRNWLKLLKSTLGPGVAVHTRVAGGVDAVHVDPVQLQNAVLNLAINARDAMNGKGRLTLEVGRCEPGAGAGDDRAPDLAPGRYVRLAMSDTGAGMSAEVRERAFDPFFTTKGPGGGSGLGLAMVYGFAEQSGGHVRFERTSEPGTTVALYLPAAQAPVVEPSASGEAAARGRGEHVLLVEDEFDVRDVVARALERMGYRVRAVGDADTGLSHLEDGVEVLVSDVGLPGGRSGVDLAREARALRPDLPVLLISGHAAAAIAGRASLPEGVTVLQKPVHLGELARSVRAALDEPTPCGDERSRLTP